jgi:hypothetical protein
LQLVPITEEMIQKIIARRKLDEYNFHYNGICSIIEEENDTGRIEICQHKFLLQNPDYDLGFQFLRPKHKRFLFYRPETNTWYSLHNSRGRRFTDWASYAFKYKPTRTPLVNMGIA